MYRRTYGGYSRPYSRFGFGRRYGYSRGVVGKARASGTAAKRSVKTENVNVTCQGYMNFTYGVTNPPTSNVIIFHPYIGAVIPSTGVVNDGELSVHGGAVNDRSFRLRCAQYDEVRLDSMRVYINPVVSGNAQATPAMTIGTIWDRKASPRECGFEYDSDIAVEGRVPTAEEVLSNEGCIKSVVNMNSVKGVARSIYASNMQEKALFWDSTLHYATTASVSPLTAMYLDSWSKKDGVFCPALYVVSQLNMTTVFGTNFTCSYRVEYNFTFRNPKSEISDFIVKENPGYVNPVDIDPDIDPNRSVVVRSVAGLERCMISYADKKKQVSDLVMRVVPVTIETEKKVEDKKVEDSEESMEQ